MQECISNVLQRNRQQGRPDQRKDGGKEKKSMLRENDLLRMVRMDHFISAPCLGMQMTQNFDVVVSGTRGAVVWDLRHWRHCIFNDQSRFSLYHSDGRARVCQRQGERLIDACIQLLTQPISDGPGCNPSCVGGVTWSSWIGRWTGINTSRFWWTICYHRREGCSVGTLY